MWLLFRPPPELPSFAEIRRAVPELRTKLGVFDAFQSLARQGRIEYRHGSRNRDRGHRIVRIVATGAVLRTVGCPLTFDGLPRQRLHPVSDLTLWRVLEAVEECANCGVPLPNFTQLGTRAGRSGTSVRRALDALQDEGLLKLIEHGTRRVAELPDGRRTL
jgi:hypothetical protein